MRTFLIGMGNIISNDKAGLCLNMSNGGTSVLISVLVLSGSDLAKSDWEKELITWFAAHDQSIYGLGVVDFDLDEIAWDPDKFQEQRDFLLKTIDLAITRHRWEVLNYDPPFVMDDLKTLRHLVESYIPEMVDSHKIWDWEIMPNTFTKCARHDVYLHAHGCAICNNE